MDTERKLLINHTTRIVHSAKSKKPECQPRKDDNVGYADTDKGFRDLDFILCECTKK